ncbi:MAG: TIM barrel protein [Patescibacteria group bacterium]|jgi:sugar phosphate isomerase/epimerase
MDGEKFHKELLDHIELLEKHFPGIGICCFGMSLDDAIGIFNTTSIPMQFKPKSIADMRKIFSGVKNNSDRASIHLPNLRFDERGDLLRKDELLLMLCEKTPPGLEIITIHLGWKDVDAVLDADWNWKNTELAVKVKNELSDVVAAGFQSGKTMTLENLRYKPWKHQFRELFSSRSEHLIAARKTLCESVAEKIGRPAKDIIKKTGFTLDAGHASGNAHLNEKYTLEFWLKTLGRDIKVIHLHDMRPEEDDGAKIEQTHTPIGEGIVDWKKFFKAKNQYCPDAPMVIELPEDDTIKSIEYLLNLK